MKRVVKKILKYKSKGDQFIEASVCILATVICSAFPDGEERKAINKCFDKVFDQLKELGLLHSQDLVPVKRKSR